MRLLLDSHALLWWHDGSMAERTRAWVAGGESEVYVSVVSAWELGIKHAKGGLALDVPLREIVDRAGFTPLAVSWIHAEAAASLPPHHRDPFDRMLVAQAQTDGLSLVTDDRTIARYDVHTVPAS